MPSPPSQKPASFENRLNAHPELRAKIEVLLSVEEKAQVDLIRADAAEQRVIEEICQLGQVALQDWAARQEQRQSEAFSQENPRRVAAVRKVSGGRFPRHTSLKSSIGIVDSDALKF
jgi:hypothetical protein